MQYTHRRPTVVDCRQWKWSCFHASYALHKRLPFANSSKRCLEYHMNRHVSCTIWDHIVHWQQRVFFAQTLLSPNSCAYWSVAIPRSEVLDLEPFAHLWVCFLFTFLQRNTRKIGNYRYRGTEENNRRSLQGTCASYNRRNNESIPQRKGISVLRHLAWRFTSQEHHFHGGFRRLA